MTFKLQIESRGRMEMFFNDFKATLVVLSKYINERWLSLI